MSKGRSIETEYGSNIGSRQVAPPEMRLIDILYGRLMKAPEVNIAKHLTTLEELATRCGVTQRNISDLINQGKIVLRTPSGTELIATKISVDGVGLMNCVIPIRVTEPKRSTKKESVNNTASRLVDSLRDKGPNPIQQPGRLTEMFASSLSKRTMLPMTSWECFDFADLKAERYDANRFKTANPTLDEVSAINKLFKSSLVVWPIRFLPDDEIYYTAPDELEEAGGPDKFASKVNQLAADLTTLASQKFSLPFEVIPFSTLLTDPKAKALYEQTFNQVLGSFTCDGLTSPYIKRGTIERDLAFREKKFPAASPAEVLRKSQLTFALYTAETAAKYYYFGNNFFIMQNEQASGPKYDVYTKINPAFLQPPLVPVSINKGVANV